MAGDMSEFFDREYLADVKLLILDNNNGEVLKEVYGHQIILVSASEWVKTAMHFRNALPSHVNDNNTTNALPCVTMSCIDKTDVDSLMAAIQYMYTRNVDPDIDVTKCFELLRLADYYRIAGLARYCSKILIDRELSNTALNTLWSIPFAYEDLQGLITSLIEKRNWFTSFLQGQESVGLPSDVIQEFIDMPLHILCHVLTCIMRYDVNASFDNENLAWIAIAWLCYANYDTEKSPVSLENKMHLLQIVLSKGYHNNFMIQWMASEPLKEALHGIVDQAIASNDKQQQILNTLVYMGTDYRRMMNILRLNHTHTEMHIKYIVSLSVPIHQQFSNKMRQESFTFPLRHGISTNINLAYEIDDTDSAYSVSIAAKIFVPCSPETVRARLLVNGIAVPNEYGTCKYNRMDIHHPDAFPLNRDFTMNVHITVFDYIYDLTGFSFSE